MIEVDETIEVAANPDKVWDLIGHFDKMEKWHPAVERTEISGVGAAPRRTMHLSGGGQLVEEYVAKADPKAMGWSLVAGPFPVTDYKSELSVTSSGPSRSIVRWSARFKAAGVPDDEARQMIKGAFRAGLDTIPARL
jgi:Polyketide cyclase / dehydrase and lipid transport